MFDLGENEKIILVVRKHWLAMVFEFLFSLALAVLPLVLFFIFRTTLFGELTLKNSYLLLFLYTIFIIFVWTFLSVSWINYYLDIWVITNERLVDIDQKSLFSRDIANLRLDRIQDVKIEMLGIINTLFKIGNIYVQTASAKNEFTIRQAGNPEDVKRFIMQAYDSYEDKAKLVKLQP